MEIRKEIKVEENLEEQILEQGPIEYDIKEPHLNDIFGLDEWDLYKSFANENGYEIHEVSPIVTEEGSIRQFQVVEREIHVPTEEEQRRNREQAYTQEVDPITCHIDRLRDKQQTPEIEQEIADLQQERSEKVEEIKERYPYPVEE